MAPIALAAARPAGEDPEMRKQLDPSRAGYVHFLSLDLARAGAGLCSGRCTDRLHCRPPGSELDHGKKRPTIGGLVPPIGRTNGVHAEYRRACFVYDRQGIDNTRGQGWQDRRWNLSVPRAYDLALKKDCPTLKKVGEISTQRTDAECETSGWYKVLQPPGLGIRAHATGRESTSFGGSGLNPDSQALCATLLNIRSCSGSNLQDHTGHGAAQTLFSVPTCHL
jgi:hypothetical protein